MIKEIKYFLYLIVILIFIFFTGRYYFSDLYKKKSYKLLSALDEKIILYSEKLPVLENDTLDIIKYVKNTNTKKKKKYYFWELLKKDD